MPVRSRVAASVDLVQDFDLAAEERYWDALELWAAGRPNGSVYLLGYVGEMVLKHATFRIEGGSPNDSAGGFFGPARRSMRRHYPGVDAESYHNLWFWAMLVRLRRNQLGRPLPPAIDWGLVRAARVLRREWTVSIRYRVLPVADVEWNAAHQAAEWLFNNRHALWR